MLDCKDAITIERLMEDIKICENILNSLYALETCGKKDAIYKQKLNQYHSLTQDVKKRIIDLMENCEIADLAKYFLIRKSIDLNEYSRIILDVIIGATRDYSLRRFLLFSMMVANIPNEKNGIPVNDDSMSLSTLSLNIEKDFYTLFLVILEEYIKKKPFFKDKLKKIKYSIAFAIPQIEELMIDCSFNVSENLLKDIDLEYKNYGFDKDVINMAKLQVVGSHYLSSASTLVRNFGIHDFNYIKDAIESLFRSGNVFMNNQPEIILASLEKIVQDSNKPNGREYIGSLGNFYEQDKKLFGSKILKKEKNAQ